MPYKSINWITRNFIKANPDSIFVFGDNYSKQGYGGQAKECRGEPNSFGIATKYTPEWKEQAFFKDSFEEITDLVLSLMRVENLSIDGKLIYLPSAGIGTERAELKTRAPICFSIIKKFWEEKLGTADFS